MTRNHSLAALSIAAIAAFGACGGGSSKAAAPNTTEPAATTATTDAPTTVATPPAKLDSCALVPEATAETLIATKLQPGVHESTTDVDSCTYSGDPSGPTAQVEVFIGAGAKHFYDDDHDVLQHMFTDVPGLGDEGHEEDFNIFFRKGTTWVALRITSLDDWSTFKPRAETAAKELASKI
jgi:hypothetical protein